MAVKVMVVSSVLVAGLFVWMPLMVADEGVSKDAVEAAVKKACEYLKAQQKSDGHWEYNPDAPFRLGPPGDKNWWLWEGSTALVLLALLKGGIDPDEECIKKGFAFIKSNPFKHTYSVACYILALEALYDAKAKKIADEEAKKGEPKDEKGMTRAVDEIERELNPPKAKWAPDDWKAFCDAVDWLVKNKNKRVWRYPQYGEDASNAQYAMLAISAAQRMKVPVPDSLYWEVAGYYLGSQEKEGPEVKPFHVPIADLSMKDLLKVKKDLLEGVKEAEKEAKKMGIEFDREKWRTTAAEKAHDRIFGGEPQKMWARGWCYMYDDPQKAAWRFKVTGAMTASAICALAVCKAGLGTKENFKTIEKQVNQAIRDGCAWVAHYFAVDKNPSGKMHHAWTGAESPAPIHHFYWLYALERIGILCLVRKFGDHDWYVEGTKYLLGSQRADGSWDAGNNLSLIHISEPTR
ncbi:MAG: hypothetical protein N2234_03675, partial [Planctomycetota bacterium]|nr:hypothetical protein [Planctomycetota bacterium]